MMAFISRIHQLRETLKSARGNIIMIISERSVFTDKVVFAKMLHDNNKIGDIEYNIYCKWFYEFVEDIQQGGLIYVKTNPENCEKRVIKRNRKGETIPLSYLRNCHKYHEEWLSNESLPVLQLDGDFIDKSCLKTIEIFIDRVLRDSSESHYTLSQWLNGNGRRLASVWKKSKPGLGKEQPTSTPPTWFFFFRDTSRNRRA